jgi:hypothetical protein
LTKQELSQCYYLNKEIEQLERELRELDGKEYKPTNYSGMPHGSGISDDVSRLATQRAELHKLISLKLEECMIARTRIERYINGVEDSELRMILRLRHINGLSFQQIAFSIGGHDESAPRKKYNKFLGLSEKSELRLIL